MMIIMMNKMCKIHTFLLVPELIFCNNPVSHWKNPFLFLSREHADANMLYHANAADLLHAGML